jgi:E3 ubiquitin-protein ligase listerin
MFPGSKKQGGGGFGGFTTSSTTLSYLTPPPDFSEIPQEVVVPFKNLLKKASTTKEKALQDILTYVHGLGSDGQGLPESVIDAYVCPSISRFSTWLSPLNHLPG